MSSRARFVLAFLLTFSVVEGAAADEAIRSQFATVNGVKLHYVQAGSGTETPIVLLHGTARNWARGRSTSGNFPQAFAHMALISAAYDLDRRLSAAGQAG
jgi:pimeloyl-ACP methyl ester carboxylesterase